jgi:hypothetical protein
MIKALMEAEKDYSKGLRKPKLFKPVWKVLPLLSPYLIQQINDLVTERKVQKHQYDWSIVLIDLPDKTDIRRSVRIGPFRFHLEDEKPNVDGIYIILKYEEKSEKPPGVIFVGSRGVERSRSRSPDDAASEGYNTRHRRSSIPKQERERERVRPLSIARRMSSTSRPSHINHLQRDASQWGPYTTSPERSPERAPERVADYTDIRIERGDRRPATVLEPRISLPEYYYESGHRDSSDDDVDIDIRHARQRNSRERERVRYSNQRQSSPLRFRYLRATVVDEDDEDELLSSGEEIADRLITKHTRPLAESGSENKGVVEHLNIDGERAIQQPTALSDITEEDEKTSNGKENAETKVLV